MYHGCLALYLLTCHDYDITVGLNCFSAHAEVSQRVQQQLLKGSKFHSQGLLGMNKDRNPWMQRRQPRLQTLS
jgi:hypothetical protein